MLLSFVLLYASVQINCINIRNAAKMELNNVSARIYADTFHSQREANLTSYMSDISLSTAYKNALRAGFTEGMRSRVKLTNDDYDVENQNILSIILRTVDIFSLKDVIEAQKEATIAIEIDAKGTSLMEIDDIDKCIDIGYKAIMENKEQLLNIIKEK